VRRWSSAPAIAQAAGIGNLGRSEARSRARVIRILVWDEKMCDETSEGFSSASFFLKTHAML
jgi:hypothetical protein